MAFISDSVQDITGKPLEGQARVSLSIDRWHGVEGGGGTPNLTTMNTKTESNPTETCQSIKLGIDAHAKWFRVVAGICIFNPFDFAAFWTLCLPCGTHLPPAICTSFRFDSLDCPFAFVPLRLPSVPLRYDCTRPAARPGMEGVRWFHLWISNHFGSTIKPP